MILRAVDWKGSMVTRLAALLAAALVLVSLGCGQKGKSATVNRDAKMLSFTLTDVQGRTIDMRQHLGKVVIIDFWDTWCGPCRREIPHFVELYSQYKGKGLEVVGVAFARQGPEAVRKFGDEFKINYTSTLFNDQAQKLYGSPSGIPTTYIIDRNGAVAERVIGYRDKAFFEQRIKALLKV
jgi:thiol-disulfide isomerase/thioredoxin